MQNYSYELKPTLDNLTVINTTVFIATNECPGGNGSNKTDISQAFLTSACRIMNLSWPSQLVTSDPLEFGDQSHQFITILKHTNE